MDDMGLRLDHSLELLVLWLAMDPVLMTRNFEIRWTQANCTIFDASLVAEFDCAIVEKPKRQGNFLNTRLQLQQNLNRISLEMRVCVPKTGERQLQQLFRVRVDGCQMDKYQSKNRVVNAVLKKLLQTGNYPKSCPLLAGVNYTSLHFTLNPDHFPPYMPDMKFTTFFAIYLDKNTPILKAAVESEVMRRLA